MEKIKIMKKYPRYFITNDHREYQRIDKPDGLAYETFGNIHKNKNINEEYNEKWCEACVKSGGLKEVTEEELALLFHEN